MTAPANSCGTKGRPATALALFGREWLRAPLRVGAVAPSSAALAQAVTAGMSAADGPVIELGPGTGVFTHALLNRGIAPDRIAAIEAGERFAIALALLHPDITVICADAARLRHLTPFAPAGAGAIICGLPLLSMPPSKVMRILAGSFAALRPGGTVRLFTYGSRCPVPKAIRLRLGLVAQRTAFVALNIPPATVYHLVRREDAA
ncbi:MAG: hypothetical protein Q8K28_10630 [Hoeflea sp.]|uniref:class I SAM-dependent methyltransferase n=1 Tax=Hoeflea sp. TaxID=1940281 RepID=UPI00272F51DF|nr:hypothetical protein [Hoeflea sp.]MDP2120347.1 hypothetical protein [Hoeflea sp.]